MLESILLAVGSAMIGAIIGLLSYKAASSEQIKNLSQRIDNAEIAIKKQEKKIEDHNMSIASIGEIKILLQSLRELFDTRLYNIEKRMEEQDKRQSEELSEIKKKLEIM